MAFRSLPPRTFDLRPSETRLDDANHTVRDLILKVKDGLERAIVFVGPKMRAGFRLDELRSDAKPTPPPCARLPLEHNERRVAGDGEQPFDS